MQKQATLTAFTGPKCLSNGTKKNSFKVGANNGFENERTILRKGDMRGMNQALARVNKHLTQSIRSTCSKSKSIHLPAGKSAVSAKRG